MHRHIYGWAVIVMFFLAYAEAAAQSKASKYLLSGDYTKAQPILSEGLKKKPEDIGLHFDAARFYFFNDHKQHKLETAWTHITRCEALLQKIKDPKQIEKLKALGIRTLTVKLLKNQIENSAFQKADSLNNSASWEHFISKFSGATKQKIAIERRNDVAFKEAQENFSYESFKDFMEKYPNAAQVSEAKKLYESLLYKKMTQPNTWQAYKEFLDKHSDSPYADEARAQYELLLFKDVCKPGNIKSYIDFIQNHAANRYVPQAEDSVYSLFIQKGNAENFIQFAQQFPKNKNAVDAWRNAYLLSTAAFTPASIETFVQQFPAFPLTNMVVKDKKLASTFLLSFEDNELYGYKDTLTKEIKIKPVFEEAAEFSGRLAAVKPKGCEPECKFGYINREGVFEINAQFNEAGDFLNGFAVVGIGNCLEGECLYGLINETGKIILPVQYEEVYDMTLDGLALIKQTDKGYGFANAAGKITLKPIYNDAHSFSEGLAAVKKDSLWRFIDVNGNAVIPPLFYNAGNFANGLAPVCNQQNLWGYINTTGAYVIPAKFAFANAFENGKAIVLIKEKNKKGIEITVEKTIDLKGNFIEAEKSKAPAPKKGKK